MKVLITDYSFDPVAKTIRFNNLATVDQNRLLLITNATKNTIIYNFASPALGGTISGNVITLNTTTAGMDINDKLQIFYENDDTAATNEIIYHLKRISQSLRGAQNVDSSDRIRVALDNSNIGNLPANITQLYSTADMREMLYNIDRINFGNSIRPLITGS
jgi:hypothetical protein